MRRSPFLLAAAVCVLGVQAANGQAELPRNRILDREGIAQPAPYLLPQPPGDAPGSPGVPQQQGAPYVTQTEGANPSAASAAEGGAGDGGASGGQQNNGTNPAQNASTFIFSNEYYTLDGGNRINTSYARFKFPIYDHRGSVLLEIPYVYYNFTATVPDLPQIGGMGDVKIQGSFNSWTSENKRLTLINFLELYVPSADNAVLARTPLGNALTAFNLGTGKYVLGPGVGCVYAFQPNTILAPLYFYEASIFGSDTRATIRRGKWRIFFMHAWESGLYVLPEFQVLTNYLTGNNDIYVAPEIGYSHKKTTLYFKPGVGIDPDPNDRQWGIEFGARVQF